MYFARKKDAEATSVIMYQLLWSSFWVLVKFARMFGKVVVSPNPNQRKWIGWVILDG